MSLINLINSSKQPTAHTMRHRLARVDPMWDGTGNPTVIFAEDIEAGTVSGPFTYLDMYTPLAGDWILLTPLGNTYIVTGKIINNA